MNHIEKYNSSTTWWEKAIIMGLFHMGASSKGYWTITNTAKEFKVSIGLASENLQLADAMQFDSKLINCKTREEALKRIHNHNYKVDPKHE